MLNITYLCGHNNPIMGFRPALKLLFSRLLQYAIVPYADDLQPPHQTLVSEEPLHPFERHGRASGTNTLQYIIWRDTRISSKT